MARKKDPIVPFFPLRFQISDTLEAVSHEILMAIQAMEFAIDLGAMSSVAKKTLQERVDALKKVCMSEDAL